MTVLPTLASIGLNHVCVLMQEAMTRRAATRPPVNMKVYEELLDRIQSKVKAHKPQELSAGAA